MRLSVYSLIDVIEYVACSPVTEKQTRSVFGLLD